MADTQQLAGVLSACMSPDAVMRHGAEEMLKQIVQQAGGVVLLLQATHSESLSVDLRQLSAIHLKNAVKRGWGEKEKEGMIHGEDKEVVKKELLGLFPHATHAIRVQLDECLKEMISQDFPERWPDVVHCVQMWLGSGDQKAITAALRVVRIITRKYEYRDDKDRIELNATVEALFPSLLATFGSLVESRGSESLELAELLKLCCKIFYSTTYMEVPPMLVQDDAQYHGWMNGIFILAEMRAHVHGMPDEADARADWPWWKLKKWVYQIVYRMFVKYGVKRVGGTVHDVAYGEKWSNDYSMKFLHAMLHELSAYSQGAYVSPRVANLLLQILEEGIGRQVYWKELQPHIQIIIQQVVIPMLCFDDADEELWVEDPEEYIRKGYDIIEDIYSPKTAAVSVLYTLCSSKKKNQLDSSMAFLGSILQEFQSQGQHPSKQIARKMDGALLAIGSLSENLRKNPKYATQVPSIFQTYILNVFGSQYGHLRAKACWVSSEFAEVLYLFGEGSGKQLFMQLFDEVQKCLRDPELPVQVDASIALRAFFDVVEEEDGEKIIPMLPLFLQTFIELANKIESEGIMSTIESIVEKFSDQVAPYAIGVVTALVEQFWKIVSVEEEAAQNENEDIYAAETLAGHSVLRTVATVLDAISKSPEMYPEMENILFPLLDKFFCEDGLDIIEELLEITTYFTFYSPQISPRMWSLYPKMMQCIETWAGDYMSEFVPALDNFISRGTQTFIQSTNPPYLILTNNALEKCFHQERDGFGTDEETYLACAALIQVILEHCRGLVDHCIQPYMALVVRTLVLGDEDPFEDPAVVENLLVCGADALYYNPLLTLKALQQNEHLFYFMSKLGEAVTKRTKKSNKLLYFRNKRFKKTVIIGLSSIIGTSMESMPPAMRQSIPQIVAAAVSLIVALKEQEDAKAADSAANQESSGPSERYISDSGDERDCDEDEDELCTRLAASRDSRLTSLSGGHEEDWDSDYYSDLSDSEDDITVQSPLDNISPYFVYGSAMLALQAHDPETFTSAVHNLDETHKSAVEQLMSAAHNQ